MMFNILVILLLGVSGLVGLARGATREVVGIVSFLLAAVIAIFALRYSAPIAMHSIKTEWLAKGLALLVVFVIAYIVLRIIGRLMTAMIPESDVGGLDRLLGLGFGLIRGLIILGLFNIVLTAAVPAEKRPDWITKSSLYPWASLSSEALQSLAPQGSRLADKVTPALKQAIEARPQEGAAQSAPSGQRKNGDSQSK